MKYKIIKSFDFCSIVFKITIWLKLVLWSLMGVIIHILIYQMKLLSIHIVCTNALNSCSLYEKVSVSMFLLWNDYFDFNKLYNVVSNDVNIPFKSNVWWRIVDVSDLFYIAEIPSIDYWINFDQYVNLDRNATTTDSVRWSQGSIFWSCVDFYVPFEKGGVYCFAHFFWSVCLSVSLPHFVQLITQERFAPEASNLVGR